MKVKNKLLYLNRCIETMSQAMKFLTFQFLILEASSGRERQSIEIPILSYNRLSWVEAEITLILQGDMKQRKLCQLEYGFKLLKTLVTNSLLTVWKYDTTDQVLRQSVNHQPSSVGCGLESILNIYQCAFRKKKLEF